MPTNPNDRTSYMYVVTLRGTGKCYVGITTQKPRDRWYGHKHDARNGGTTHFQRALRKYGPDAFDWECVGAWFTWSDACEWERTCKRMGFTHYNMAEGGEGALGVKRTPEQIAALVAINKNRVFTPETLKLMSQRTKEQWAVSNPRAGCKHTEEAKKAISEKKKGCEGPNKGRVFSDEARSNMSKAKMGKIQSEETKAKRSASLTGHKRKPEEAQKRLETIRRKKELNNLILSMGPITTFSGEADG